MKIQNILLAAAILFTTSTVFAKNDKEKKPKKEKKVEASSYTEFNEMDRTDAMNDDMYVSVFRMDSGWDYFLVGYTAGSTTPVLIKDMSANAANRANLIASGKENVREALATIDGLPEDVEEGLNKHAISIYQFSVSIPEEYEAIGLIGGKGVGNLAEALKSTANNGNDFFSIGDGNVIYFGKSNWVGKYQNGAMFLMGGEKLDQFGAPLPAPVVTLLIALGFGAALVMYRNRKQMKA